MSSTEHVQQAPGLVARVADLAAAHRRIVIVGWIVLLFGSLALSSAVGTNFENNFSLPGTDSQRAINLLKADFPAQAGDADQIVFSVTHGSVTDAATRARIEPALKQIATLPHVTAVVSPYTTAGAKQISRSGDVAFATVTFDENGGALPKPAVQHVINVADAAGSPGLQVALGGQAIEQAQRQSIGAATAVGLLAAIIVLLITFGSFAAMGLPILTALLGLGTGIGLAGLASQVISMPDFATELAAMIGLGVGIDYALFIVTRFRENYARRAGRGRGDHRGHGHRRPSRAVRRHHGDHRPARPVPARRGLPLRPGRGLGAGGADDDAGGAHRPAGAAVALRRAYRRARPARERGDRQARTSGCAGPA